MCMCVHMYIFMCGMKHIPSVGMCADCYYSNVMQKREQTVIVTHKQGINNKQVKRIPCSSAEATI